MQGFVCFSMDVPDDLVETPNPMPDGWDVIPSAEDSYDMRMVSVQFGTKWIREQRSLVLRVPSVVVPYEFNLLLNPLHPAFDLSKIAGPFPVKWDERLA
jgi:RES domain-containing protein